MVTYQAGVDCYVIEKIRNNLIKIKELVSDIHRNQEVGHGHPCKSRSWPGHSQACARYCITARNRKYRSYTAAHFRCGDDTWLTDRHRALLLQCNDTYPSFFALWWPYRLLWQTEARFSFSSQRFHVTLYPVIFGLLCWRTRFNRQRKKWAVNSWQLHKLIWKLLLLPMAFPKQSRTRSCN